MDANLLERFARHISVPEIGPEGQERLARARVVVAGGDLAAGVAAQYLTAAGVGTVRRIGTVDAGWPDSGQAWLAALAEAGADLVVRSGFDDDAMLGATKRLGIAAIVVRALDTMIDLISFPNRAPAAEAPLDAPAVNAEPAREGPAAVVAGALAAAEAIHVLVGSAAPARAGRDTAARHLRLPLDERPPQVQEIPWA